jgi:hypothetical protein
MKNINKNIITIALLLLTVFLPVTAQDIYKIEALPINSKLFDDFAPVYFENGIIFCSNRKSKVLVNYSSTDDERLIDLYQAQRKDSVKWGNAKILAKELTTVFNEGPCSYNTKNKRLFLTRNIEVEKKGKRISDPDNKLGIFYTILTGGKWGNITAFPYNDPDYNVAHPSISNDGNRLFFASDKPGGYGNSDLYMSIWENGNWSEPVNLGSEVNTAGSELYPFYHDKGRLYFSSDNHNSSGGLDIFFTSEIGDHWVNPTRLSAPFNSGSDDFGFIADELLDNGFFTSNRYRNDDIFSFTTLIPKITGCDTLRENSYCYLFFELGLANLDTLPFIYEWDLGDGNKIQGDSIIHCFQSAGTYMVQLNVIDPITGEVKDNQASYLVEAKEIEQAYINSVDTSFVGEVVKFDGLKTNLPNFTVAEYLWNFDDGNRGTGAEITNIFGSPGIYNIQLLIRSVPDNQGSTQEACVCKNVVIIERPSE